MLEAEHSVLNSSRESTDAAQYRESCESFTGIPGARILYNRQSSLPTAVATVSDQESIRDLFQQAARQAQAGHLSDARSVCEQGLKLDPGNVSGVQLLAQICWHLGDVRKAESLLQHLLAENPRLPGVWNDLGDMLDTDQEHEAALGAFQQAVLHDPNFAEAWFKLGIKQAEGGDLEQAKPSLQQALKLQPGNIHALYTLGQVCQESNDLAGAIGSYQRALEIDPDNVHLLHSLGIAFRQCDRREDALNCYNRAIAVDAQSAELFQSQGHVLHELGRIEEARRSYQRSLQLKPDALDVHDSLNSLYWQYGMHEEYLQSYGAAIQSQPESLVLRLHYASALLPKVDVDAAAEVLGRAQEELKQQAMSDPVFHRLMGKILVSRGFIPEAKEHLTTAIKLAPQDIPSREVIARLFIVEGNYQHGLDHIEAVAALAPYNQSLIAYRCLCWRLLGNPQEAVVNDYERFIKVYKVPLPAGYKSHREFNLALNHCLDELHKTRVHPMGQTLRAGTQTQGNIFNRKIKEIQEIRRSIEHSIEDYIDSMEVQAEHPLLSRKSARFRFTDSWSCRLLQQGYHTNHIHPQGWISSCYYVNLPESVRTSSDRQGWIKFGETNLRLGDRERIGRYIQPEEGRLVLFPSYMFHGTVPFMSAESRTTIAFDVVPDL